MFWWSVYTQVFSSHCLGSGQTWIVSPSRHPSLSRCRGQLASSCKPTTHVQGITRTWCCSRVPPVELKRDARLTAHRSSRTRLSRRWARCRGSLRGRRCWSRSRWLWSGARGFWAGEVKFLSLFGEQGLGVFHRRFWSLGSVSFKCLPWRLKTRRWTFWTGSKMNLRLPDTHTKSAGRPN